MTDFPSGSRGMGGCVPPGPAFPNRGVDSAGARRGQTQMALPSHGRDQRTSRTRSGILHAVERGWQRRPAAALPAAPRRDSQSRGHALARQKNVLARLSLLMDGLVRSLMSRAACESLVRRASSPWR
jgi:hypothetical protein